MKPLLFISLLFLAVCGQNSSPEGRMTIKMDVINKQIDSLKLQNTMILDSLAEISKRLHEMK